MELANEGVLRNLIMIFLAKLSPIVLLGNLFLGETLFLLVKGGIVKELMEKCFFPAKLRVLTNNNYIDPGGEKMCSDKI